MALVRAVEYGEASPEVRAVYDDIMATRKITSINNFWKVLACDPATLKRTWEEVRDVMAPGTLDALTKELIYIAVSATNNCEYCSHSHTASARKRAVPSATSSISGRLLSDTSTRSPRPIPRLASARAARVMRSSSSR